MKTALLALCCCAALWAEDLAARRVVILKVDGLNADLLYSTMQQMSPESGRSELPWLTHIFRDNGTVMENFYTRGISLSAPSWSMLDTGHHTVVRGNVEYDRYTGQIYDYLNFFPFYLSYARWHEVDMPGVEVLDRAGIPLLLDRFPYPDAYQSFQLFQRGVRWSSLKSVLKSKFASKNLLSLIEGAGPSLDELWTRQTELEVDESLRNPAIRYLDFYTGDLDHKGHATNDPATLLASLKKLDALAGRLWTAIQATPEARQTLFVMVSDHGMNNQPGVYSQSFSVPDLLNSPDGGAHHVVTNRHELSDYKLKGLDPFVQRVINPSSASFYLKGEASQYPTAWVDLDGNERASIQLRNSDLNKIHILLLGLARSDVTPEVRRALLQSLMETIERHREMWLATANQLDEELKTLQSVIEKRKETLPLSKPKKWSDEQHESGADEDWRRLAQELTFWEREHEQYSNYVRHLRNLMAIDIDSNKPLQRKISDYIPEMSLGDNNSVYDLQNYVAGPAQGGFAIDRQGQLDGQRSFRLVDYFRLLSSQRVRNNPQKALSSTPIDFTVMRVPLEVAKYVYWVYGDEGHQLLLLQGEDERLSLLPISHLKQTKDSKISWTRETWGAGYPLHLFEDAELAIPEGQDRGEWLSAWHSESEWMRAIHKCLYSNGVIGITEQFSPVAENVPGTAGFSPVRLRYERRRRELVQPDFQVFAANHWNFNVRNFNPGGNHGSFFRISTHSVWMMAGGGVPVASVEEPTDSLDFAPRVLRLLGMDGGFEKITQRSGPERDFSPSVNLPGRHSPPVSITVAR